MGQVQGPRRVPLPAEHRPTGEWREKGLRGVRHLSNWALAALVVGVGATTAVLARASHPATSTAGTVAGTASGGVTQAGAPTLHSPVTLTTPSGVVIQSGTTGGGAVAGTATVGGRRIVYGGDT